ncbi:polysaccharide deacetylase family protein [Kitasatospora sp. NBC_00240]|uniref:polysaccharide deacetylase family protein n=1 Tax=Kitasatospora sp. NBC_00240 TaxID=2903567 RepID=UPI002253A0EA|nr:polysaccharide deacetylase family protein [Kitasatospora sp. NBC_00240]MCX5213865.1 polysaccharide deacetylase family protein [Kitasatospora sp. NBC_00240]
MPPSRRELLAALAGAALTGCQASGGDGGGAGAAAPVRPAGSAPATTAPSAPATAAAPGDPAADAVPGSADPPPGAASRAEAVTRADLVSRYGQAEPTSWGFDGPGVLSRLPSADAAIALTFDACGGPQGNGYDEALIGFLRDRAVPATLFLNSRWIDANLPVFRALAADPLFEIANHGTRHCPLSVSGRSAYDIPGTRDVGEVVDEVTGNRAGLTELLGRPPRFFRSGTAYLDDVAARIVADLGERFAGFTVNGDGGATFTAGQVHTAVTAAGPGAIVLAHMNHPAAGTAAGIATAVPRLLDEGRRFVRLSDAVP